MSRGEENGDFLGRWSARKLKARAEPAEAEPAPPDAAPPAEPAPEMTEADYLAEHGLPEPETLGKGDDFSAFLRDNVPAALRSRALRRLWLTDPVFANLDGLLEYGEDFTDAATAMKEVKTIYRVGKGMLRELEEAPVASVAAAEAEVKAPAAEAEDHVTGAAEPAAAAEPAEPGPAPSAKLNQAGDGSPEGASTAGESTRGAPEAEAAPEAARPRRMRFRFGV